MTEIEIRFGAASPSIADQLKAQGLAVQPERLKVMQRIKESSDYLYVHSFITQSTKQRINSKLMKLIFKYARLM